MQNHILSQFWHFFSNLVKTRVFLKNLALPLFFTSCKKKPEKKKTEKKPRKFCHWQRDREMYKQTRIHRTLPEKGDPISILLGNNWGNGCSAFLN